MPRTGPSFGAPKDASRPGPLGSLSKLEALKTNFRTRATRMTDRVNEEGSPFDREGVGIGLFVDSGERLKVRWGLKRIR